MATATGTYLASRRERVKLVQKVVVVVVVDVAIFCHFSLCLSHVSSFSLVLREALALSSSFSLV